MGGYQPGLDGVRALAILAVLGYHERLPWTEGAFLGLSLFFTLSGFLITALLLGTHDRTGGIDLRAFWARRFRRLLPAAMLALVIVMIFGHAVASAQQADALPGQVAAASTYTANWYFIATDTSYIELFTAPSPVQHFWSLAIEEQFYLLMPIGLVLVLRRKRAPMVLGVLFGGAALASTVWMAYLFSSGARLDRLYYGTDTRIAEILVGAVLAVVLTRTGLAFSERMRRILAGAGVVALAVTLWCWANASLTSSLMWRGGFLAYAVVSGVLILGVLCGRGPLAALLSIGLLAGIGRISYGLYLYHWPIFLWLTESRTGLDRWPLFALRLAVTFTIAVLSYFFVERPILRGARSLRRAAGRILALPPGVRRRAWSLRGAVAPVMIIAIVSGTYLTVNRSAPDALATLRVDDATFLIPPGEELDILVVAADPDDPIIRELDRITGEHPRARIVGKASFACRDGLVTTAAGARTCTSWRDDWPDVVETHDPDVVLLHADDWEGDNLEPLTGSTTGEEVDSMVAVLSGGFDLLTERGATIVWGLSTEGGGRAGLPFHEAMRRLGLQRTDVFKILGTRLPIPNRVDRETLIAGSATAFLEDLALYGRGGRDDLTRVMVVGDSQSRSLGYGLERWATEHERAIVWNVAVEGCGMAVSGEPRASTGQESSGSCQVAADAWPRQVATFDPDLVIVQTGFFDVRDRRIPDSSEFREFGDEEFDSYLVGEYVSVVDRLTDRGASLLWMTAPCVELAGEPGTGGIPPYSPENIAHLNEVVIPQLESRRDARMDVFDLSQALCPDGDFVNEADGISPIRVDGVHFSEEGSLWFARTYGEELLAAVGADHSDRTNRRRRVDDIRSMIRERLARTGNP